MFGRVVILWVRAAIMAEYRGDNFFFHLELCKTVVAEIKLWLYRYGQKNVSKALERIYSILLDKKISSGNAHLDKNTYCIF